MKIKKSGFVFLVFMVLIITACSPVLISQIPTFTPEAQTALPTVTQDPLLQIRFYRGNIPTLLAEDLKLPASIAHVKSIGESNVSFEQRSTGETTWVYALVAPFPTTIDDVNLDEIKNTWFGKGNSTFQNAPLIMSDQTRQFFESIWGKADPGGVSVQDASSILDVAWKQKTAWAIIPFEDLQPKWKVLKVNGQSPLYKTLDLADYPLVIRFGLKGDPSLVTALNEKLIAEGLDLPKTNWDPGKMTTVLMTGTTTLYRMIELRMEEHGITWPGEKIKSWMTEPDFTHVSNEASFFKDCPKYDPNFWTLTFCSQPESIKLLQDLHVNVVELTGNHLLNFGFQPMLYSLQLYKDSGIQSFGGGANAEEARQPLLVEKDGNKIAFIGCNKSDTPAEWATDSTPGAAHCDFEWLSQKIAELKSQGYVVIATLQDLEGFSPMPMPYVQEDFIKVADMGANAVSGSSAHFPEGFEFRNQAFIHFGLGNLFFDQMDYPVVGTRREFLDRYVIYDRKIVSIELLTALLEDYAQPRPMTPEERLQFLNDLFTVSNW